MTEQKNTMDKKKVFACSLSASIIEAIKDEAQSKETTQSAVVNRELKKSKFYKNYLIKSTNGSK